MLPDCNSLISFNLIVYTDRVAFNQSHTKIVKCVEKNVLEDILFTLIYLSYRFNLVFLTHVKNNSIKLHVPYSESKRIKNQVLTTFFQIPIQAMVDSWTHSMFHIPGIRYIM